MQVYAAKAIPNTLIQIIPWLSSMKSLNSILFKPVVPNIKEVV